jgi:phenylacetic acid degradation operon negative regulatory protein
MLVKNNARILIMDLLFADPEIVIHTKQFVMAAQLFGITENNIRVALTRLSSEGLIESAGRGVYRLTLEAKEISEPVVHRTGGLKMTCDWAGDYLAVHTGSLGRADRTALKRRERTLRLSGFRELQSDLFIRPNNFAESLENTRTHLVKNGLDTTVAMFIATKFDDQNTSEVITLWDKEMLNVRYKKISQQIQSWFSIVDQLELGVAARESLLIGRQAIPLMMTDPLLPEPFIDSVLQQQFINDVKRLDLKGHQLWQELNNQILLTNDISGDNKKSTS